MQYAPSMLAAQPANGLTCGIDWARDDHAIAIVDERGHQVHRSTVEHSAAGLVGEGAGAEFLLWLSTSDLPDPESVIADPSVMDWKDSRRS